MSVSQISRRLYAKVTVFERKVPTSLWNPRVCYSSQTVTTDTLEGITDLDRSAERSWKDLPGPRSLPFIGTIYKYLPGGEYHTVNRTDAEWKKFKKFGEIVKEEIFPGEVFIHLFHPDDIQQVYRTEGKYPFRGALRCTEKYKEDRGMVVDLSNSKGDEWASIRFPTAKEILNPKLVASYMIPQDQVARDLVTVLKARRDDQNKLGLMTELNKYSIEAVSLVLFNKRLGMVKPELEGDGAGIFEAVHHIFEGMYHCQFFWPLHKSGKSKIWKQYEVAMDFMLKMSRELVLESLQSTDEKPTFVQRLIARGMSEEYATDVAMGIFFGGIDTTSNAVFFLLYNLAKNQEKQDILYQSIKEAFPEKAAAITVEQVKNLHYLKACMKESFRLTPTATGTLRILDKDIVLRNCRIPAGMTIQLHNAVVSRRDDLFENPEKYFPERWMREYRPKPHAYATLPFSHGTRNCVGKRFAEQEIMLAAIQILQHFRVEYEGPPVEIHTKMLAYPKTDVLKFSDRA